jgi:hypothetical protein
MENQNLNKTSKIILLSIAIGIWAMVLQNAGIIPTNQNVKVVNTVDTHVTGGTIDADVSGRVDVDNTVSVSVDEVLAKNGQKYYFNNR